MVADIGDVAEGSEEGSENVPVQFDVEPVGPEVDLRDWHCYACQYADGRVCFCSGC